MIMGKSTAFRMCHRLGSGRVISIFPMSSEKGSNNVYLGVHWLAFLSYKQLESMTPRPLGEGEIWSCSETMEEWS